LLEQHFWQLLLLCNGVTFWPVTCTFYQVLKLGTFDSTDCDVMLWLVRWWVLGRWMLQLTWNCSVNPCRSSEQDFKNTRLLVTRLCFWRDWNILRAVMLEFHSGKYCTLQGHIVQQFKQRRD